MRRKRTLAMILCAVLALSAMMLLACGKAKQSKPSAAAGEETAAPVAVTQDAAPEVPEVADDGFDDVTVFENEYGVLQITSVAQDDTNGYTVHFALSGAPKESLYIEIVSRSVNEWACYGDGSVTTDGKQDSTGSMTIFADKLAGIGVAEVLEIPLTVTIRDRESFDSLTEPISFTFYPKGEEAAKNATVSAYVPGEKAMVLIDNESAMVSLSCDPADPEGFGIDLYMENRSDHEMLFDARHDEINGAHYTGISTLNGLAVPAGKRGLRHFVYSQDFLTEYSLTDIWEISWDYDLYDRVANENVVRDHVTVYPLGEDAVQPFTRKSWENEKVLIDNRKYTLIVTGFDITPEGRALSMKLFVENKCDFPIDFGIDTYDGSTALVNGVACNPATNVFSKLEPGKRAYTNLDWYWDAFTAAGLTEDTVIENVTLPLQFYNSNKRMSNHEIYLDVVTVETW